MVGYIDRLEQIAVDISLQMIDGGIAIRRGVMPFVEGVSRSMHDVYSLDGFEKWSKAVIADLKFVSFIPGVKGVFDQCIKTLEAQKDMYYATKFIGSTAHFIVDDNGRLRFRMPTLTWVDARQSLYCIGDYFELGKFLQKNKVAAFSTCTELSNKYGAVKIFNTRLDDIPVFGSAFERPKDICIFLASIVECVLVYLPNRNSRWENILKVTSSAGKMMLITFGKHHNSRAWFAVIDLVTQNASLAALIVKSHNRREDRFNRP